MNKTQEYFIHLLSSHLNNSPPLPEPQADWMGVFKLGELHNVTAMLTLAIKKLPADSRPPSKIMNLFNQALGMTIQSYENKIAGINKLTDLLNKNDINHLFVKGAAIRSYYPVGEVRTSGDTDVIVNDCDLITTGNVLIDNGFKFSQKTDIQVVLFYNDEEYEIKNYLDGVNKSCEEFFDNPFKYAENIGENTYTLKPVYHLIYVISHLLRHLTIGGVGIRQLMDVDVLLRSGEIDINELISVAGQLNIEKSAMVLIALAKEYFNTPIEINYEINEELKSQLENVMLSGGVFGYAISDHGTQRMVKSLNTSEKSGFMASLKAFLTMVFPSKDYLYRTYNYCNNHHFLLPVAFFQRLFEAVFKRGKSNSKAVKNLFSNNETAIMINDIINELNLEI